MAIAIGVYIILAIPAFIFGYACCRIASESDRAAEKAYAEWCIQHGKTPPSE